MPGCMAHENTMPTYRCRDCRRDFSIKTDSLMHSSPLGCQTWVIAIYLATTSLKGVSSMKLHSDREFTQESAWHLLHRIRENFADQQGMFFGTVEIDKSFMGGKSRNMHAKKRAQLESRAATGKAIVAGIKDRPSNKICAKLVPDTKPQTLRRFVEESVRITSEARKLPPWLQLIVVGTKHSPAHTFHPFLYELNLLKTQEPSSILKCIFRLSK